MRSVPKAIVPAQADAALSALRDALLETGCSHAALDQGMEAAQLVHGITADLSLSHATLLHQVAATMIEAGTLPASLRALTGTDAVNLATALWRLGEFRLDARWSAQQALPAQQAETVRKMLLAVVGDPRLIVARLACQVVRARHARDLPGEMRRQIAWEMRELYAPLANRLGVWNLKWELEDLAFRELEPEGYQRIANALNEKRADRERYIEEVCQLLAARLHDAGITASVVGRPKHIYSIWRKMQRKHLSFERVFDVRAARVIVGNVADCYAALGIVHGLWPFLPSQFDDYIATPKHNDYRSIHTAVSGPDDRPLEIQIRTSEMQAQAELGVAAHWRYKEGGVGDRRYERKIQQVRELLTSQREATDNDQLSRLSAGLFDDRVYAMTPRGDVVDLPRGGTPLDFAFHLHSSLGERCRGAKVDGRIVPLNQPLRSGDVVEILTGKTPAPSRDWLSTAAGYLASSRARAKLRAYFRRLDTEAAPSTSPALTAPETPVADEAQPLRLKALRPSASKGPNQSPVDIEGVGDLPVTLARCCTPMRPQPIRGYLTLGRGVTIHRANCAALARMLKQKPQRHLQVEWVDGVDTRLPARIRIEAYDRRGLLRDLSDAIAEERISIEGVTSHTDPRDHLAHFEVRLTVRDASELARLQRRLGRIPNVLKVRRGP
jgi:GTP pyrophosphokinase